MEKILALTVPGSNGPIEIQAPSGVPSGEPGQAGKIIQFGVTMLLIVVVILALGFLMYGGLNWIMSQGDKTKLESARRTIIYAILGLLIAFLSFFALTFLGGIFNINFFNLSL